MNTTQLTTTGMNGDPQVNGGAQFDDDESDNDQQPYRRRGEETKVEVDQVDVDDDTGRSSKTAKDFGHIKFIQMLMGRNRRDTEFTPKDLRASPSSIVDRLESNDGIEDPGTMKFGLSKINEANELDSANEGDETAKSTDKFHLPPLRHNKSDESQHSSPKKFGGADLKRQNTYLNGIVNRTLFKELFGGGKRETNATAISFTHTSK